MMEEIKLLLSKIHAEFRRLRSGELGDNLRAQGIDYKIIWGLESYRLKEIAERFRNDLKETGVASNLATALWNEEVRESKLLATRLYPVEMMTAELAETWSKQVKYTELADQLSMNLLSRVEFAEELVKDWTSNPMATHIQRYMALQIAIRRDFTVPQAESIAQNPNYPIWVRTAAAKLIIEL